MNQGVHTLTCKLICALTRFIPIGYSLLIQSLATHQYWPENSVQAPSQCSLMRREKSGYYLPSYFVIYLLQMIQPDAKSRIYIASIAESYDIVSSSSTRGQNHDISMRMLRFETHRHILDLAPRTSHLDPRQCNHPANAETRRNIGGDLARQARLPAFSQFNYIF